MSKEKIQVVRELHAPARRVYPRRRVIVRGFDDLWQADLVDMQPYVKVNKGFKYILTVIDVLSKYGWAAPLKSKNAQDVTEAFQVIIERGRKPANLQTDNGKEFYNSNFKGLMQKHNINHYSTYSVMKASVVERWNRTLKNSMWQQFSLQGSYKWLDLLPGLVKDYNDRRHRTIGMPPAKVTPAIAKKLLDTVYNNIKIAKPAKYHVGDRVRINKYKAVFDRGFTPNWSAEVFEIRKIQNTNPTTYLIQDSRGAPVLGSFYTEELKNVRFPDVYLVERILRRKGKKVYVKWYGMDASHNSWIDNTNKL